MDSTHSICVLKVKYVSHCQACVDNLKKLLLKINGVISVDVDAENETVTVSGDSDPEALLEALREKKKKAKILSYKNPRAKNKELKQDKKIHTSDKGKKKEEPEHVFDPYVPKPTLCKDPFCKTHQTGFVIKSSEPSLPGNYPLPSNYPPPGNYSPRHWGVGPPMYPRRNYWPERQTRSQKPFRFDRQVAHPQFDPYVGRRPPQRQMSPPYYDQYGHWG